MWCGGVGGGIVYCIVRLGSASGLGTLHYTVLAVWVLCTTSTGKDTELSMETEKSVLSRLLRNLTIYGSAILTLLLIVFIAAVKLRLLAKFGYYLGSVGLCFLLAGMLLLFNTGLLIIGNVLILAGITITIMSQQTCLIFCFRSRLHSGV